MALKRNEIRALLWLLPVLAVASWLVWETAKPRGEGRRIFVPEEANNLVDTALLPPSASRRQPAADKPAPVDELAIARFDPNTIDYHSLLRLGFSRGEALGIIKYRERGKIFQIPEDFAACYQVSEEMYLRLRPYIIIGEQYRLKPFEQRASGVIPSEVDSWTDEESQLSTFNSQLSTLIELNSADSITLVTISGIGALTAGRIIEYRTRLGGFAHPGQLAEIRGMTEQNYERIVPQIFVDTLAIQKIEINFALPKRLAAHPYIGPAALRKLLSIRQLKGGWRTAEELTQDDIFTTQELSRLRPYLIFN